MIKKPHIIFFKNLLIIFFFSSQIFSQQLTNLEKIYELIDKSGNDISLIIKERNEEFTLKLSCPAELNILEQRVRFAFSRESLNFNKDNPQSKAVLNYNVDNAGINYKRVFKDGWFGDLLVEREAVLKGTFVLESKGVFLKSDKFEYSDLDTVKLGDIARLENNSLPFTKNEIPPEPFFSGLLEPVIAVGTAVVTVILFFTVRSK